jgi:hypothetical protein
MSRVWPSASDLATDPTPIVPPAPTRFSTMMVWPSCVESRSLTMRATMSVPLPGLNGTMTRIGFDGQVRSDEVGALLPRPVVVWAIALPERAISMMPKADNPQRRMYFSLTDSESFWTGRHRRRQKVKGWQARDAPERCRSVLSRRNRSALYGSGDGACNLGG